VFFEKETDDDFDWFINPPMKRKEGFSNSLKPKTRRTSTDEDLKIQEERRNLPIYAMRDTLIQEFRKSKTLVLIGETGSGKTTQVPQYLYECGILDDEMRIGITQPRRIAATSLSQRVAKEMGAELGDLVGYSIRFEDVSSNKTRVKFLTDGMLIREAQIDPLLEKYQVIILDESHERTVNTDVLFGILKKIQKERDDLRVIIMSATLEAETFAKFFDAKIVTVKGRQHNVELFYTDEPQSDYVEACITAATQLHLDEPEGDILVFLTGQEDIESVTTGLEEKAKLLPPEAMKMLVCPIFSALPSEKQMEVFEKAPIGCRKVILATNIAETSITINGIKYVVDSGLVKLRVYNPLNGLESLKITTISKASAQQRMGRAGRESAGKCYRLYTEESYESMNSFTVPEIQRCNLAEVVLQMLSMGIKDPLNFDFIDKPTKKALAKALEILLALGALDKNGKISEFGKAISQFPLPPMFSTVLMRSVENKCVEEILSILSMLSVETIFYTPYDKRAQVDKVKLKYSSVFGDHVGLLRLYQEYSGLSGDTTKWCWNNFVNSKSMVKVNNVRRQLRDLMKRLDFTLTSSPKDMEPVRRSMVGGFFLNAAVKVEKRKYRTLLSGVEVRIHPTSLIKEPFPEYLIFNSLIETSSLYIREVCSIESDWLREASPEIFKGRIGGNSSTPTKKYQVERDP
jgi:HrpA-like RNA helicase